MVFDLDEAQRQARTRLGRVSSRRRRSDAGRSRLAPAVLDQLRSLVLGMERPSMTAIRRRLADLCIESGQRPPSRATLYNALSRIQGHRYDISRLPPHVAQALYNLAPAGTVPGHQLVFYCFSHGSLAAVSYAAGLPWLDLYQASRLRGWRPRSRGLLRAALQVRGLR